MRSVLFTVTHTVVALLVLFSGCVSLERSYPDQRYFVLEVKRAGNPSSSSGNGVLEVADVEISPRFTGKSFVYRMSEARYESDFYNQFLVAPAVLITEEILKGLAQSHVFRHVIGASHQLQPTHVLGATVNGLYGDFRNGSAPKAVLEIEIFLSTETEGRSQIVMEKRYAKSVNISRRSPEALVQGWNRALEEILAVLVTDLKSAH